MSLEKGLTLRYASFVMDEKYNAEYMAAWEAFRTSPMRRIELTRKSLTPALLDRFIWNNERGDLKATYFLAKDSFYTMKKLSVTECSWWPLYLSFLMSDMKSVGPREALDLTLEIESKIKDEDLRYSSYVFLFGWFVKEGKPLPLELLQKLAMRHSIVFSLIMDELYFRYEDTGDREDLISSFEELNELTYPSSSVRFLGHYFRERIGSDEFRERLTREDCIRKFEEPKKPQKRNSWYYGEIYQEEYREQMAEWEFYMRWKTMAEGLRVTDRTVIFSPGTSLAGCCVIPEKSMKVDWDVLIGGSVHFMDGPFPKLWASGGYLPTFHLDIYRFASAIRSVYGWLTDGGGRMTLPMRQGEFIPGEWRADAPLYSVVVPPREGMLPTFARRATISELELILGREMSESEMQKGLAAYDRLTDPYSFHTSDPEFMALAIEARCRCFRNRADAEGAVSLLIDLSLDIRPTNRDSYSNRAMREVKHVINTHMEAISSLWMIPVDWNEDPGLITASAAENIADLYRQYPEEKRPFSLMEPVLLEKLRPADIKPYLAKKSTVAPILIDGVDALMKEHPEMRFKAAVMMCFVAVEEMEGRYSPEIPELTDDERAMVMNALTGSDSEKMSAWHAGDLKDWSECSPSSSCPVPKGVAVTEGSPNFSQSCFFSSMEKLVSLSLTGSVRNQELNWKGGLSGNTDQELRAYQKWRMGFLSGRTGLSSNLSHLMTLFAEMTYAPEGLRGKAVSVMMRLAAFSPLIADHTFIYILKNGLPMPCELLGLVQETKDGAAFTVASSFRKKKVTFDALSSVAPALSRCSGPWKNAIVTVLPGVWSALYGDELLAEDEGDRKKGRTLSYPSTLSISSLTDAEVSLQVPHGFSYGTLNDKVMKLMNAVHSVIYDIVVLDTPHPVEGYTENECFLMRKTIWETLFLQPSMRRRCFPGWKMPKDPVWPFELGAGEKRNRKGIRSVPASYFISPDSMRRIPQDPDSSFFIAAENGALYDGLLCGPDSDEGIARAVLSAGNGPEEMNGELAYRFWCPSYSTRMTEKEPELFRSALSTLLRRYVSLEKRKKCPFDSKAYAYGRIGVSDVLGWYLPFERAEDEDIAREADNAVRRLRGTKALLIDCTSKKEWVGETLEAWIRAGGRDPEAIERIELSSAVLSAVRKDSDSVREALRTEDDEEETILPAETLPEKKETDGDGTDLLSLLDEDEKAVLKAILAGGDPEEAAEENFTLLDVVIDSVNTKALDVYGEAVLAEDGVPWPEWLGELMRIIGD